MAAIKGFSKSIRYVPEFQGNDKEPNPFVAIITPLNMHKFFLVTEVYQRAGLSMQDKLRAEEIPVDQMREIVETLSEQVVPHIRLEGATDQDGEALTMQDVITYAPLYPLAQELYNVLLMKSAPSEDDEKNSERPPV